MPSNAFFRLSALLPLLASPILAQQPGQGCTGDVAYCITGSPIILRCSGTTLQPGNCDDNLNEPMYGALCIESSPTAGDAVCSAIASTMPAFPSVTGSLIPLSTATSSTPVATTTTTVTTTSAPTATPTATVIPMVGDACTGDVSYCVAGSPIILRCDGTALYAGNCDDNLDEPPLGALCIESYVDAGDAVCSAIGSTMPAFPSQTGTFFPYTATSTSVVVLTTTISVSSTTTPTSGLITTASTTSGTLSLTTIAPVSEYTDGQPQKPTNASTVIVVSPTITPFMSAAACSTVSGLVVVLIVAVGTILAL